MLGAYLHRDWPFKCETAEEALEDSGSDAWPERLTQAAAELHAHRPPRDDEEAARRFLNALCDYHPSW